MTKLSDIQSILLTGASSRETGSLLPAAASIADAGERLNKALAALLKRGLAEERPAPDLTTIWRTEGDDRIGVFITASGRLAIGDEPKGELAGAHQTPARETPKPARQTKSATVIALLERKEGATLSELIDATGWLPHTTRAALTGLRKKGHAIDKSKRGDATCYRIVSKA